MHSRGISAHTLTSRLRLFERRGIVTRTAYAEIPPRVVYELTDLGRQLRPVLDAMYEWGMNAPPLGLHGGRGEGLSRLIRPPAPPRCPIQNGTT